MLLYSAKKMLGLQSNLMDIVFNFAHMFSQLLLNDTEIGLFTAIVLVTAGMTHTETHIYDTNMYLRDTTVGCHTFIWVHRMETP